MYYQTQNQAPIQRDTLQRQPMRRGISPGVSALMNKMPPQNQPPGAMPVRPGQGQIDPMERAMASNMTNQMQQQSDPLMVRQMQGQMPPRFPPQRGPIRSAAIPDPSIGLPPSLQRRLGAFR